MNFQLPAALPIRPRTALRTAELGLLALVAAAVALLLWTAMRPLAPEATPAGPGGPPPAAPDLTILARFDPFHRGLEAGAAGADGAAAGGGGLVLYGVRYGTGGGAAILGSGDGPQQVYDVGDQVAPGVTLAEVGPDHVILSRGGGRQRLGFPIAGAPASAPTAVAEAAAPTQAPAAAPSGGPLIAESALLPRMQGGKVSGFQVIAPTGSPLLQSAGIQRGDILLAVNGAALTPEAVSALPQKLASASEVELRFERAGQVITKRVRVGAP